MRPSPTSLVLGLLALPGCPDPGPENPPTLWLSSLGTDETRVQLVDTEPRRF